MSTSAAAAARTVERLKRESRRNSILSIISITKHTKRDNDQPIAQCFGTYSRCERGTTVLEKHRDTWFQPRLLLKYTTLALTIASFPVLIAPLVAIGRENRSGGIMTSSFAALVGLTVLLLVFCALQIWKFKAIPRNALLSYGVLVSLGTLGMTVASLHLIPQSSMYERIIQCAGPNQGREIRNCAEMQRYLDVMTVAQCFCLLASFSAFTDCCFSLSQRRHDKGKGTDTEKGTNARESMQFTTRRDTRTEIKRASRFSRMDERNELDYPPPDFIEEEEASIPNVESSAIGEQGTTMPSIESSAAKEEQDKDATLNNGPSV